jgi:hypothetical protein
MAVVGWVAIGVVAAIAVTGVAVGLASVPDMRRYLRIRHM